MQCWITIYQKYTCSAKEWELRRKYCSKPCADKAQIWTKQSEETKRKRKESLFKETDKLKDYSSLRLRILERDKYICKKCWFTDKEIMEVDHIKPRRYFPELGMNPDNLETLCPNCHRRKSLDDIKKREIYEQLCEMW